MSERILMAVFTIQFVLCKFFLQFQWTSFMVPREHRLLRHTIFCSWTWNYWNNRYIWMKFELLRFEVFDIKLFRTKSSRCERVLHQMRSLRELFRREASVDNCIKCSRKVCNIFWKTLLAKCLPVNVLQLEPSFLFKKRRLSQIIAKIAARILQNSRETIRGWVLLLTKILKIVYSYGRFLENFLNFSE